MSSRDLLYCMVPIVSNILKFCELKKYILCTSRCIRLRSCVKHPYKTNKQKPQKNARKSLEQIETEKFSPLVVMASWTCVCVCVFMFKFIKMHILNCTIVV